MSSAAQPAAGCASLSSGYSASGLEANYPGKPILCATCHGSNALSLAGYPGIPPLTTSMHSRHASVTDPASGTTLDAGTTRTTCYRCHPGPKTECLRGAMATLKDASGANEIDSRPMPTRRRPAFRSTGSPPDTAG